MIATEIPTPYSKARGLAKRDLIAQAAIVVKILRERADLVQSHIDALKDKEIDEWQMVDAITESMFNVNEFGLPALQAKLLIYQLSDLEVRRQAMLASVRGGF